MGMKPRGGSFVLSLYEFGLVMYSDKERSSIAGTRGTKKEKTDASVRVGDMAKEAKLTKIHRYETAIAVSASLSISPMMILICVERADVRSKQTQGRENDTKMNDENDDPSATMNSNLQSC